MKERLMNFMRAKGLTSSKFAELMESPPSRISHLLSGRNNPSYEFLERMLLRFPEVNPDWLLLGKGDMFRSDTAEGPTPVLGPSLQDAKSREMPGLFPEANPYAEKAITPQLAETKQATRQNAIGSSQKQIEPTDVTSTSLADTAAVEKRIERIVIFYSDSTFKLFIPELNT